MAAGTRPAQGEVTRILVAIERGESVAGEALFPLVYDELRQIAVHRLAQLSAGETLTATTLVHEAYLRLMGDGPVRWESRRHFFGAAARAMQNILVDHARRRRRRRHGSGWKPLALEQLERGGAAIMYPPNAELPSNAAAEAVDIEALAQALDRLAVEEPRQAEVVRLRYLAGLSIEDTARALDASPATVKRDWNYAKAWLYDALNPPA